MTAVGRWVVRHRMVAAYGPVVSAIAVRNIIGLAATPPGTYVDEASIGYNAWALGHHGVDEHGVAFPLFPEAFGEYKNPVYIYALAAISRFAGMSIFVERLPAALFGLGACILVALTVGRMTSSLLAGSATLLLAGVTPWMTLESRVGFEVIAMVTLLSATLWCLAHASPAGWRWYAAAGVTAGGAIFAYSTARLEVGLLALALLVAYARPWRTRVWVAMIPIGAAYALLGAWMVAHPGALTGRYDLISITRDHPTAAVAAGRFAANYLTYFDPAFLFLHGDAIPRHSTGYGGMLLLTAAPLIAAGAVWCVRWWSLPLQRFTVMWLVLAPVAAALTADDTPHALRAATMLPALMLMSGCGVHLLMRGAQWCGARWGKRRLVARVVAGAVMAAICIPGAAYLSDLYTGYPRRAAVQFAFDVGEIEAVRVGHEVSNGHIAYLVEDPYYLDQPYIQAAFEYLPPPPRQPESGTDALLASLRMEQVNRVDASVLQSGDAVIEAVTSSVPPGGILVYANATAAVYVITSGV